MPYYKRTGMISHRHPFHDSCDGCDLGYDIGPTGRVVARRVAPSYDIGPTGRSPMLQKSYDIGPTGRSMTRLHGFGAAPSFPVRVAMAFSADAPSSGIDWQSAMAPIISGAIMGLVGYNMAAAMGVENNKSKGLGLALGAVTAIGQIASSWLRGWTDKALATTGTTTPTTTPTVVAATPSVTPGVATPSVLKFW